MRSSAASGSQTSAETSQYRQETTSIVALDIGGANLKYVDDRGNDFCRPFAMWKESLRLAQTLAEDLRSFESPAALLVTMTGELADCFEDRTVGVRFIVDEVMRLPSADVWFYELGGTFIDASAAKRDPMLVAAANWHATANWFASQHPADTLLVDIGTTTADIIPIGQGRVQTLAKTDPERLAEGSLVYVGGRRTPVCSLVRTLPYRGAEIPIMNEFFATIDDARILLGWETEDAADHESADQGPRTKRASATRMLRMIGHDLTAASIDDVYSMASRVHEAAGAMIQAALDRFEPHRDIVLVGQSDDLIPQGDRQIVRPDNQSRRCGPCEAMIRLWKARCLD